MFRHGHQLPSNRHRAAPQKLSAQPNNPNQPASPFAAPLHVNLFCRNSSVVVGDKNDECRSLASTKRSYYVRVCTVGGAGTELLPWVACGGQHIKA